MKLKLLLVLLLSVAAVAQPALELVESFPSETDFDQPDIRDTQEVWLELIDGAQYSILWQTFYLAHQQGEATEPVVKALRRAAERGVSVKILVDPKFRKTYPETLDSLERESGVEVRSSPVGPWLGGVMHAKLMLVDGASGFLGSQNFDWRSLEHIRELGIVFRDAGLVKFYESIFMWEWERSGESEIPVVQPDVNAEIFTVAGTRLHPTVSPNRLNREPELGDEYQILKLLEESKKSIDVALLSYSPVSHDGGEYYSLLDSALRAADVRGVKVRLLLSHWVEDGHDIDHIISLDTLDNIEVRACRIAPAAAGDIPFARVHHSKYLISDGSRAWLGTSNWSKDYFHSSRNYGMVLEDGPIPSRLEQLFEFDWARSTGLDH